MAPSGFSRSRVTYLSGYIAPQPQFPYFCPMILTSSGLTIARAHKVGVLRSRVITNLLKWLLVKTNGTILR